MKKIEAKIIADSINEQGNRITSLVCTFPRFILAELNTHRMFSRNSASSRAIPFEKMLKSVEDSPFIPIAWQKDHKGMQGTEYLTSDFEVKNAISKWIEARDCAINIVSNMSYNGVTKQLCNRLLEPFMWHTAIITATEWENFFHLRCPEYRYKPEDKTFRSKKDWLKYWKECFGDAALAWMDKEDEPLTWLKLNKGQAEIHMMALAEAIWDAINENVPSRLEAGEWHIPFGDKIDVDKLYTLIGGDLTKRTETRIKIATARCARVSYINYEGKDDYEADIKLYDILSKSGHWSPFEHCGRAMSKEEYYTSVKGHIPYVVELGRDNKELNNGTNHHVFGWSNNFKGFIQLRALIEK